MELEFPPAIVALWHIPPAEPPKANILLSLRFGWNIPLASSASRSPPCLATRFMQPPDHGRGIPTPNFPLQQGIALIHAGLGFVGEPQEFGFEGVPKKAQNFGL